MKRRFRLTGSNDFKRVRQLGKSYAHPLVVLVAYPNETQSSRFGVAAGRTVGNAIQRNRAKRLIREALRPLIPSIPAGWDLVFISRKPMCTAGLESVQAAVAQLLRRSRLVLEKNDERSS